MKPLNQFLEEKPKEKSFGLGKGIGNSSPGGTISFGFGK